jgi:hypothetical protein
MKNSSKLLPEIDRKRSRSSSGCAGLHASSITRRLKASQLSSRLKKRFRAFPGRCGRPLQESAAAVVIALVIRLASGLRETLAASNVARCGNRQARVPSVSSASATRRIAIWLRSTRLAIQAITSGLACSRWRAKCTLQQLRDQRIVGRPDLEQRRRGEPRAQVGQLAPPRPAAPPRRRSAAGDARPAPGSRRGRCPLRARSASSMIVPPLLAAKIRASRLRPDLRGPTSSAAITGQVAQRSSCWTARRFDSPTRNSVSLASGRPSGRRSWSLAGRGVAVAEASGRSWAMVPGRAAAAAAADAQHARSLPVRSSRAPSSAARRLA